MLTAHGVTHVGHVRKTNEDHLLVDLDLGLFLVADGMGGHIAGEVASRMAVETIRTFIARSQDGGNCTWPFGIDPDASFAVNRLKTAVKLANRRVFRARASMTTPGWVPRLSAPWSRAIAWRLAGWATAGCMPAHTTASPS